MAAGAGAIILAVAKWAVGIGAGVIATDLLNDYYQKNKGKIGTTFEKFWDEFEKTYQAHRERYKPTIEILDKPKSETETETKTAATIDKEQTNGLQGSYSHTDFYNWLNSAEGQKFLNETAPKLRAEGIAGGNIKINPEKQEQIDSIQGNYDVGTYQEHYDSTLGAINRLTAKPGMFDFTEDETVGEMLPNPGEDKYDEEKTPIDTPTQPGQEIVDKTDENLGTNNIGAINWLEWAEQEQAKRWEREDAIRKETQEREDNAYQRAVEDMKKAGINPNLMNVSPAQSGGGITQATGQNIAGATSQMNLDLEEMQQLLDQAFKGDENDKDRFADLLGKVLNFVTIIAMMKK